MIYRLLKIIIGIGIKLFYREIRIKNRERLNHDGPVILVANHPNTLMDAWMMGYINRKRIYYMAKATFFNTPLKKWLLGGLGLIPINRATESKTKGVSNQDSFENCYRLLESGKTLVIFPEGNSFKERQLRKLKSGTARIALEVERRNEGKMNLRIIPVGLVYTRPETFRSSVLVNVGEGMGVNEFLEGFENDSLKTARIVTDRLTQKLEDLLVGSNSAEYEALGEDIVDILSSNYVKTEEKGVEKDVKLFKQTFARLHQLQIQDPDKLIEISDLVYKIKWQLDRAGIKSDFLDRNYRPGMFIRQLVFSVIFLIIGLPISIYGLFHNFLPFKFTDFLVSKIVEDLSWRAAIAVLISLVVYPLTYLGFIQLSNFYLDLNFWEKLFYFLSMPISGLLSFLFYRYINHVSVKTNFIFLMSTQKVTVEGIKEDREKLRSIILNENNQD